MSPCTLCPRNCGADRAGGERGACHTGILPTVASYGPHFGEEPPLSGSRGSGTIFFTHCNLRCVYCQNHTISQETCGREIGCSDLADIMLELQELNCHNINLVSPSHVVPQILSAVGIAARKGLDIPLVYNTGTYDALPALRLLDGVVDIYMPDMKYGRNEIGMILSKVPDYATVMRDALAEMYRQVGDLRCEHAIAVRGLPIRYLGTSRRPGRQRDHHAHYCVKDFPGELYQHHGPVQAGLEGKGWDNRSVMRSLNRQVTLGEYAYAVECAKREGLYRGIRE